MDHNSKRILKFLNKNRTMIFSLLKLSQEFPDIDKDYLIEIVDNLKKNGYVKFVGSASIKSTNKGKTYFSSSLINWLYNNALAIVAIIISIIALFK